MLSLAVKAFPRVKYNYIDLNALKQWDYKRYSIDKCIELRKDFLYLCRKYNLKPMKSLYNTEEWKNIKQGLKQVNMENDEIEMFKNWFDMNATSYNIFFKNRVFKNLENQSFYTVHHILEKNLSWWFQDSFSETYILINPELSFLQHKKNLLIMDDFIHTIIHMFINKFDGKDINNGARNPINFKYKNSTKMQYLLREYGRENIELLLNILDNK